MAISNSKSFLSLAILSLVVGLGNLSFAQKTVELPAFSTRDVFDLEYASNPQISPSGKTIVYIRRSYNVLTDGVDGRLWEIDVASNTHRKLTTNERNESNPHWSPSGDRLAFTLSTDNGSEIYIRWTATGQMAKISSLPASPSGMQWSPDGSQLAFSMYVEGKERGGDFGLSMPAKPKGAKWADAPRVTTRLRHEQDGRGYLKPGFSHLFVLTAEGGTPRQLTSGEFQHGNDFDWLGDGSGLIFSANRRADADTEFRDSDVFMVTLSDTSVSKLTDRYGPDNNVTASPDGRWIAYLGYEYNRRAYQRNLFNLMSTSGASKKVMAKDFDRSPSDLTWSSDSKSLYFTYTDAGYNKLARLDVASGEISDVVSDLGGTTLGRPYTSGSYSLSQNGTIAYTISRPDRPADVAIVAPKSSQGKILTALNKDLLGQRTLGEIREIKYKSVPMKYGADTTSALEIEGWVVLPPNYDAARKYPLIVENHGGPILAYGPHFSAEIQLYAAQEYVVFYPNARGSTGYGEAFSDELYRAYPDRDYDDVMAGVDYVIEQGLVHPDSLYVTGGSAGGIMAAWMVGKNDRFRAAVVAKPVVNWISKTLVADNYFYYANGRYEGQPYENPLHYWSFSPISLVGNITTPTAVLVGLNDLRTPPSEAKQLYHALKLRGIPTALVEFPGASHGIASRPSQLVQKVQWTLGWFEKYSNRR
jgi:dipeptidyl aminopeptidase/acylaminoacyl peptidase